ncbi:MAG: glycosyltransferase family 4 protein [Eubacteriaceae bacterium]
MDNQNTILILVNHDVVIYNFRKELVERLLKEGYVVCISCPYGKKIDKLIEIGSEFINTSINRRGINPLVDLKLVLSYFKLLRKIKPEMVLTYTIKPNIYGGLVCSFMNIPYIANITGLGTAIEKEGMIKKVLLKLYKVSLRKVNCLFFQNEANEDYFKEERIAIKNYRLLPGSGVNLNHFKILTYPSGRETLNFVFIARIMEAKGINEYLEVAKEIKKKYSKVAFHICGFCEESYTSIIEKANEISAVIYHGNVDDIREIFKITHCTILPSYHEGMANVLLESAACGRPVLASNIPGCKETFAEGVSGFGFERKNVVSLTEAIEKFIKLPYEEKKKMGLAGRKYVEENFDRQIVVDAYIKEIEKLKR